MSKVTSKLQVTIPKAIAKEYRIRPGTVVTFEPAGEVVRLRVRQNEVTRAPDEIEWRLRLLADSDTRQDERNRAYEKLGLPEPKDRGWTRDELYTRGLPR
ncbi:MAG: AbrB/MazE/SpoVT family DNA-binding domain-containing protein [Deltaproteobacteria bacterium]|nr:AbrB/MazE/SpoVT family DNA-binding domain-containing protein [Deltaproteobacteria bacterium]